MDVRISTSIVLSASNSKRVLASEASTYSTALASPRTAAAIALQNSMSKPTTLPSFSLKPNNGCVCLTPQTR